MPGQPHYVAGQPLYGAALADYLYRAAPRYNLDPNAVLADALREGGFEGATGDINEPTGPAYGPFQLERASYFAGSSPPSGNQDPSYWANTPAGLNYALAGMSRVAGGLSGDQAISAIVGRFERPANIPGEIADEQSLYRTLSDSPNPVASAVTLGGGGGSAGGGSAGGGSSAGGGGIVDRALGKFGPIFREALLRLLKVGLGLALLYFGVKQLGGAVLTRTVKVAR